MQIKASDPAAFPHASRIRTSVHAAKLNEFENRAIRSELQSNAISERAISARGTRVSINFTLINALCLQDAEAILQRLVPDGRIIGHEYACLNPRRDDWNAGSFSINIQTGRWADFATEDKGGDLISFVAYVENISQGKAARLLARMVGLEINGGRDE